jgi:TRAP-type mannitol/chloroaromatic compound transport system permease large subunit
LEFWSKKKGSLNFKLMKSSKNAIERILISILYLLFGMAIFVIMFESVRNDHFLSFKGFEDSIGIINLLFFSFLASFFYDFRIDNF